MAFYKGLLNGIDSSKGLKNKIFNIQGRITWGFSSPCKRSDICHELTGLGFLPGALFVSSWVLFAILLNCYKANGVDILWARCGTAEASCECHLRKSATSPSWAKLTIIAQNTASQVTEELPQRSVVFSTVLGEKKQKWSAHTQQVSMLLAPGKEVLSWKEYRHWLPSQRGI